MLGFGTLTKKVFGTANDRKVKAARPLVAKINAWACARLTRSY